MKRGQRIVEVHEDVVADVLLRLSAKSLLRFQSVCKGWRNHLHNKWFISKYQKLNDDYLIFGRAGNAAGCQVVNLEEAKSCRNPGVEEDVLVSKDAVCSCPKARRWVHLVGACNGLVCLMEEGCLCRRRKIMLWNPTTRYLRTITNPPEPLYGIMGFGYDAESDDYKTVWLRYKFSRSSDSRDLDGVVIYSLRSDSWIKLLGCYTSNTTGQLKINSGFNVSIEAVCHWLNHIYILSFDTRAEILMITKLPMAITSVIPKLEVYLMRPSFRGSPAVITYCVDCPLRSYDIWVLREVESEDSWIKVHQIGPLDGISSPLGLCRGEKVFLELEMKRMVMYDLNSAKVEELYVPLGSSLGELVCCSRNLASIGGRPEHDEGIVRRQQNTDSRSLKGQKTHSRYVKRQKRGSTRSVKRRRF